MRLSKAVFVLAALAPAVASAQTVGCDVEYVVQEGDTLRTIAKTAYGVDSYQLIFSRNLGVLSNPLAPPAGVSIVVPCIEGDPVFIPDKAALRVAMGLPAEEEESAVAEEAPAEEALAEETAVEEAATAEETPVEDAAPEPAQTEESAESESAEAAPAEAETVEEQPAPEAAAPAAEAPAAAPAQAAAPEAEPAAPPAAKPVSPIGNVRLLTANGLAPFADKSLRGGGMANELVRATLSNMGALEKARIVVIDDRDSHLQDLLIDGSFDIGYPWFRPACDDLDALAKVSEEDVWFCRNFRFSEPFYEFIYGFFVRRGEYAPGRAIFRDFVGGRVCRPEGVSARDLIVKGLGEGTTEIVRTETLADCFDALLAGDVDAVSGEVFAAESILAERNLFDVVEELPDLSLLQTVNAVAPLNKPGAVQALEALNAGLIDLKVSGQWFRIVGRHLANY